MIELRVKNMVCHRCILSVKSILDERGIEYASLDLGEVRLFEALTPSQWLDLNEALQKVGFELLKNDIDKHIEAVKNSVVDLVTRQTGALRKFTISAFIHEKVGKEYKMLSTLFSEKEGQTIEQFVIAQKIEYVKELLSYGELSISEIADKMYYSSVGHLSNQFKKVTGQTPTEFRKRVSRKALDKI